jgi:hypothetical protein
MARTVLSSFAVEVNLFGQIGRKGKRICTDIPSQDEAFWSQPPYFILHWGQAVHRRFKGHPEFQKDELIV